jgi:hypothetical protein
MVTSSEMFAQLTPDQKMQRIVSSYRIAIGRQPVQGEKDHWMKQADLTVQQLVDYHMQYAAKEPSFKREIIERSYRHALGRNPTTGAAQGKELEMEWWMKQIVQSYQQMMRNHVNWLDQNKNTTAYSEVTDLAYTKVFGRKATDTEKATWRGKPTTSYGMMVGALKEHANRNGSAYWDRSHPWKYVSD